MLFNQPSKTSHILVFLEQEHQTLVFFLIKKQSVAFFVFLHEFLKTFTFFLLLFALPLTFTIGMVAEDRFFDLGLLDFDISVKFFEISAVL
jgi:hypothetical protein